MNPRSVAVGACACAALWPLLAAAATPGEDVIRPVAERFAVEEPAEVPDFQRHILPLMGRLGCNGRACHGSFQGQGGFRLSLFGYDFKMDHEALLKDGAGRVDRENPDASEILQKPTLGIPHKGGKRMEDDSWQYRMFARWIEGGARGVEKPVKFERLEVTPREIVFEREGQTVPLRVVAHWADGAAEDVTCIARYRTNDESIATIGEDGVVTSKGKGDTHVVTFYDNGVSVTQAILPVSDKVGPDYPDVPTPTKVDELVVAKLRKLGIVPSEPCGDAEFLRRLSLDLTGTLPTPAEVEAFLDDKSPSKRDRKIDELLARPAYAAWWTTKLCDITGASASVFQNQGPVQQLTRHWYDWIYRRVADNVPYDKIVEGLVLSVSRAPGQSYEDFCKEQSAYYRDKDPADFAKRATMPYYWAKRLIRKPEEKALNFSYTFLGVRLECAQCHKHPFDQWTQDDFKQFTAFFNNVGFGYPRDARERSREMIKELGVDAKNNGQVQRELTKLVHEGKTIPWQEVFVAGQGEAGRFRGANKAKDAAGKAGRVITPKVLGGDAVTLESADDPREPLMDWMRSKSNPYFARAFINRVWAAYFGVGIINPPDDMNLANPPSNAALLDTLAEEFIDRGFDMKWLHRTIVSSAAYQRSWKANETNRLDERNFSRALVRRLPAEVLIDALAQATAGSSAIADSAKDMEARAIGPKAALGLGRQGRGDYAARVFGASARDTNCDCNRSNEPNLLQLIYLQNDQDMIASLQRKGGWLSELAPGSDKARRPSESDDLKKRVDRIEENIVKARKGENNGLLAVLEDELREAHRQLKRTQKREAEAEEKAKGEGEAAGARVPAEMVRQAYLRTLGRPPESGEAEIASKYFAGSPDAAGGLRDLLWALLNTKEFITNH